VECFPKYIRRQRQEDKEKKIFSQISLFSLFGVNTNFVMFNLAQENTQTKVLVCDEMGKMNTALFLKYSNGNIDWCTAVRLGSKVTHWQPLPPQPSEAE
jgi:hypothetical protein